MTGVCTLARTLVRTLMAAAALCTLGGCLNETNSLVAAGPDALPDLSPRTWDTTAGAPYDAATAPSTPQPVAASATTLERGHWPVLVVWQPRGQVQSSVLGGAFGSQRGPDANPPLEGNMFR